MSGVACTLGIDVGATKIAAGAVSFPEGRILAQQRLLTRPDRGGEAVLEDVAQLASAIAESARTEGLAPSGVGIGLCELVSPEGQILSQNAIGWDEEIVVRRLAGVGPVTIEADVRAGARAEALFGAGRGYHVFLYITVGSGIACCLMSDGKPYLGARGATGTMASSPYFLLCRQCGQVESYTLEQVASGPALVARLNQAQPDAAKTGEEVLALAGAGNTDAIQVVRTAACSLGSAIAQLVNVLDPEAVIVGGGLGLSQGLFWDALVPCVRQHIWSHVHRDLPILQAQTGQFAGLIGAAAAAWLKHTIF